MRLPRPDPRSLERPGASRQEAKAEFDRAVAARRLYDEKPTLDNAADLLVAASRATEAGQRAHDEWQQGWTDDDALIAMAGPAFDDVPAEEHEAWRREVDYLLSHPVEVRRLADEELRPRAAGDE